MRHAAVTAAQVKEVAAASIVAVLQAAVVLLATQCHKCAGGIQLHCCAGSSRCSLKCHTMHMLCRRLAFNRRATAFGLEWGRQCWTAGERGRPFFFEEGWVGRLGWASMDVPYGPVMPDVGLGLGLVGESQHRTFMPDVGLGLGPARWLCVV